jgi:hypothetical protein
MTPFALRFGLTALLLLANLGRASDRPTISYTQYIEKLQSYENQINELRSSPQKAGTLRDSVPDTLIVQTSHGDVNVETAFLHDTLNRFLTARPEAKPAILTSLGSRLAAMRAEAELYEQPSRADDATRKRLEQILSAAEFNRVHGPTTLELLKQRIGAWILKQLRKISPKVPDLQNAGQIFVWVMIALASVVAALWLYRLSRQNFTDGKREILPFMSSSRSWQLWLKEAHEQAGQGRWRDAIHCGFWAVVSLLESEGVWPRDKARTPREYLSAIPGSSRAKAPFSAITRKFEASWYGNRPTTEADFTQFNRNLEELGCR